MCVCVCVCMYIQKVSKIETSERLTVLIKFVPKVTVTVDDLKLLICNI